MSICEIFYILLCLKITKRKVRKKYNKKIETETDYLFDKAKAIFSNHTFYDIFCLLANGINTKKEIVKKIYIKPVKENKDHVGKYLTKLLKLGLATKIKSDGKQNIYDLSIIGCCPVGGFVNDTVSKILDLTKEEIPIYIIGLGKTQ